MHSSGLHFFDPSNLELDSAFIFIDTVTGKKQGFSQRQLRGAEKARELYAFCKYPSIKDFKWIVQSGHIIENDVTMSSQECMESMMNQLSQ
jgi:hypothetical protein